MAKEKKKEKKEKEKVEIKPITLYFYRCPASVGRKMMEGIRKNANDGILPHKIFSNSQIQMQHLKIRNKLMQGVMRRFDSENLPSVGKIGDQDEHPVNMDDNQFLTKKTHFLYDIHQGFLLYEQRVVSVKTFSSYVNVIAKSAVKFEFVLTERAIELLANNKLRLKKMTFKIARPTMDILADVKTSKLSWIRLMAQGGIETGSNSMDLVMSGSPVRQRKKNMSLGDHIWETMGLLKEVLNEEHGDKGAVELYDEDDDIHHPLDLIADRMKVEVSSEELEPVMRKEGNKSYIDSPKFLNVMKGKMEEAKPQLSRMFDEEEDG